MAKTRTGKRRGGKARTDADRRKHLAEMAKALAEGRGPNEVVEAAAGKYGVSETTAWNDYAEIRRQWAEQAAKDREDVPGCYGLAIVRRNDLYRIARGNGDVKTALEVDQDRCKLQGLYEAAEKPKDDAPAVPLSLAHLTPEQLKALEQLLTPPASGTPPARPGA